MTFTYFFFKDPTEKFTAQKGNQDSNKNTGSSKDSKESGALYTILIARAKEMIEKGKADDAFKAASDAVRVNGKDYRGYYYKAVSLMQLGRSDEASLQANLSLEIAPDSAKDQIRKLLKSN